MEVPVAATRAFDRAIAVDLARRGPVSGDSFRFIRKAAALQPIQLARLLAVPLETLTRWEAGRRAVDLASWLVVATIALETFGLPGPMLERIEDLRGPREPERRVDLEAIEGTSEVRRLAAATPEAIVQPNCDDQRRLA